MKVQRSRGMIGQLQLNTVENQRVQLVNSQQTLIANMREQIGLSLSQLCGLDADTLVEPSTLIMPYEGELDRINAKTGLENAKKRTALTSGAGACRCVRRRTSMTRTFPARPRP